VESPRSWRETFLLHEAHFLSHQAIVISLNNFSSLKGKVTGLQFLYKIACFLTEVFM